MNGIQLVYDFTDALHHVNDKKYKDLKVSRKVALLNRSIREFERRLAPYHDTNTTLNNWFRPLKKSDIELSLLRRTKEYDVYKVPKYMNIPSGIMVKAKKGSCVDEFNSSPLKHKNAFPASVSSSWKGNFVFRQVFDDIDSSGIKLFHNGDYGIISAKMNYVEHIPEVHAAKLTKEKFYIYSDGRKIDFDSDLKLGLGAEIPIIQGAVLMARDDVSDLNLEINKIFNLNKILQDVVISNA